MTYFAAPKRLILLWLANGNEGRPVFRLIPFWPGPIANHSQHWHS